jgi:Family of unknown function (DUF5406)
MRKAKKTAKVPAAPVMDYDPNLVLCGSMADQEVELTFAKWTYRKVMRTKVSGNCKGMTVIESAVGRIYDELPLDRYSTTHIVLKDDATGDKLDCGDEFDRGEEWLKDMLIKAEILSIKLEKE